MTVRAPRASDLEADLTAKDEEQIRWLWLPGQRESWEATGKEDRRALAAQGLQQREAAFGSGPKWTFSVDTAEADYAAYVDCDLANNNLPHGEAYVSSSAHPDHRDRGYASSAVPLVVRFLTDNTGCRDAHVIVEAEHVASLKVSQFLGTPEVGRWTDASGRVMLRYVLPVRRPASGQSV